MSDDKKISNQSGPASAAEPSMEEILASIRQILMEEENERAATATDDADEDEDEDEVVLGPGMQAPRHDDLPGFSQPPPPAPDSAITPESAHFSPESRLEMERGYSEADDGLETYIPAAMVDPNSQQLHSSQPLKKENEMDDQVQSPEGLVSEQAAQEIASKVGSLVRSVSAERAVMVGRGGITIEDLIREEVRPVLKAWLDTHLPSLVERVVRAEIGRVIDRM